MIGTRYVNLSMYITNTIPLNTRFPWLQRIPWYRLRWRIYILKSLLCLGISHHSLVRFSRYTRLSLIIQLNVIGTRPFLMLNLSVLLWVLLLLLLLCCLIVLMNWRVRMWNWLLIISILSWPVLQNTPSTLQS